MATDPPAVTVLIGAYENERTVARAVASILAQTEPRLELIVIDDGSARRLGRGGARRRSATTRAARCWRWSATSGSPAR